VPLDVVGSRQHIVSLSHGVLAGATLVHYSAPPEPFLSLKLNN
jgi:hypothetical protein